MWRNVLVPGRPAEVDQLHWNGTSWRGAGTGTPADLIDSVVPDGSGGLWATGVDVNPGGFNLFYHLRRPLAGDAPAERNLGPAA